MAGEYELTKRNMDSTPGPSTVQENDREGQDQVNITMFENLADLADLKEFIGKVKEQNIDIKMSPLHDKISKYLQKLHGDNQDPGLLEHDVPEIIEEIHNTRLIEIAADHGSIKVFQILLDYYEGKKITVKTLNILLENFPKENHKECFQMLMDKLAAKKVILDINELDDDKKSPLYYAIKCRDSKAILDILKLGASLGQVYDEKNMLIDILGVELLKKHLDSCITLNKQGEIYTFNFVTLIPPQNNDPQNRKERDIFAKCETNIISHMSKSPDLKHLLKHPVIVGFLLTKWHRLKNLFWINLVLYIVFTVSLFGYVFSNYLQIDNEGMSTSDNWVAGSLFLILLIIAIIMLVLRKLFLISLSLKIYWRKLGTVIDFSLIVITLVILIFRSIISLAFRQQLSVLAILIASFRLFLVSGHHPYWSTYVVMLRKVSLNYFYSLFCYLSLLIGFALSFNVVFGQSSLDNAGIVHRYTNISMDDDAGIVHRYTNISVVDDAGKATDKIFTTDLEKFAIKIILMMVGDIRIENNNLETIPLISKLTFILSIFMISSILVNLLNGLAVSDISKIREDAELFGYVSRTRYLLFLDFVLISITQNRNVSGTLMRWISKQFTCHASPNGSNERQPLCIGSCFAEGSEITVNINNGEINGGNKKCCCNIRLDEAQLKEAYNITLQISRPINIEDIHEKLEKLITLLKDL